MSHGALLIPFCDFRSVPFAFSTRASLYAGLPGCPPDSRFPNGSWSRSPLAFISLILLLPFFTSVRARLPHASSSASFLNSIACHKGITWTYIRSNHSQGRNYTYPLFLINICTWIFISRLLLPPLPAWSANHSLSVISDKPSWTAIFGFFFAQAHYWGQQRSYDVPPEISLIFLIHDCTLRNFFVCVSIFFAVNGQWALRFVASLEITRAIRTLIFAIYENVISWQRPKYTVLFIRLRRASI